MRQRGQTYRNKHGHLRAQNPLVHFVSHLWMVIAALAVVSYSFFFLLFSFPLHILLQKMGRQGFFQKDEQNGSYYAVSKRGFRKL